MEGGQDRTHPKASLKAPFSGIWASGPLPASLAAPKCLYSVMVNKDAKRGEALKISKEAPLSLPLGFGHKKGEACDGIFLVGLWQEYERGEMCCIGTGAGESWGRR